MKLKKVVSVVLSALMLTGSVSVVATANENKQEYNYVALGDSIAAGYGLAGANSLVQDPALILTEDLIANPVQDAYAQVFGKYLNEVAEKNGYTSTATNLSATAYRAEDVAKTITTEGYKGVFATYILEAFFGKGGSAPLKKYHDIYTKYLTNADLVSIQLGGNDIVMGILVQMVGNKNPIINAIGTSVMLTLFGTDSTISIGAGLQIIDAAKDDITLDTLTEAAQFLSGIAGDSENYVTNAFENVTEVVDAVKTVNGNADIALIGMFNPYGNSLEYNGQIYDISTIIKNIYEKAVEDFIGEEITTPEVSLLCDEDVEDETTKLDQTIETLKSFNQKVKDDFKNCLDLKKETTKKLLTIISGEIAYPLQYATAGKNVDPQIRLLNAKLQTYAEENGCIFVDVYGISNECNSDPHPNAQGHYDIAQFMQKTLEPTILSKISPNQEETTPQKSKLGDVNGDNIIDINDATSIQCYLSELTNFNDTQLEVADFNKNGTITVDDVTSIMLYLAGYEKYIY